MNGNIIARAFYGSDFLGKGIFVLLFVLCLASVTLLVYKVWLLRKISYLSGDFEETFSAQRSSPLGLDLKQLTHEVGVPNPLRSVYEKLRKGAHDILKKNKAYLTSSGSSAVYLSASDIEQLSATVQHIIHQERKKLEQYLFVLPTVVTLAPLLGLLGTVWGISVTFSEMQSGVSAMANEAVLSGLSMALGTTVVGIFVAMIALIAHNYLKHALSQIQHRVEDFSTSILGSVEMLYRVVDVK